MFCTQRKNGDQNGKDGHGDVTKTGKEQSERKVKRATRERRVHLLFYGLVESRTHRKALEEGEDEEEEEEEIPGLDEGLGGGKESETDMAG